MDEISAQRFSREVPGNIKALTKLTDKWTLNFETWRLKKSFVIKTTTKSFSLLFLISFKPTGNSTTMLVRNSLLWPVPILATNRLPCAIYPNLCCITKILHFSYIHLGKVYDAINWANMGVVTLWFSGNWHHSSKIIYATFFPAFCRWEYLFNRKVNVCFFQDEIVSFCPQKIECLHFPHRKKFESMQQAY